jgi:hypothetical protein
MPSLRCALLLILASAPLALCDDMETVRLAALRLFAWPASSSLPALASQSRSLAASLNASGFWPDIDYNDPADRADWRTINHLSRVNLMVQALATPGSPVFEDAALGASAHRALATWTTNWLSGRFHNENW